METGTVEGTRGLVAISTTTMPIPPSALKSATRSNPVGTLRNDWYAEMWCIAIATAFCGQSVTPVAENGQSPCIRPSGPDVIATKQKKAAMRNGASMSGKAIFFIKDIGLFYNFFDLRRSELLTTDTLDAAIASPAKTGFKSQPKSG